LSINI